MPRVPLFRWLALHLAPFIIVLVCMNLLTRVIGLSPAAIVAAFTLVIIIAIGTARYGASLLGADKRRLQRFTIVGIALGLIAGLVVMSTTDLAGYDTVASYAGMITAGVVVALSQAIAIRQNRVSWPAAIVTGWILGAALFRFVASHASTWYLFGGRPLAMVYESGHNELLWASVGFAVQGVTTMFIMLRMRDRVPNTIVLD
ncbi:MAG TPA: hypothetical protein VF042_16650 [Gemmatimonadaceae bacterium]